ncbi:teichoic acid translocation permease protein TagG [Clostridium tepidiprofundi DSM 19306]|uniref:Transport permease protein n=1 Tax=Clostridium tepidiprofundi DSM 19306 TaxID=1121338 RepID=A0A151B3G7_9CLOT|nr:ABC transporter permease [Clostridium tepidiprofundi]KYH34464.1 teichoic acid translocation permease protein TagG [Clostridium tepidiprofundi DSM 19306]
MTNYVKSFATFIKDIIKSREMIFRLSRNDFKVRYAGSYLGIVWAFVQPIVNILVFWFVFQVGFKSAPVDNFPFILWLICGMIPWFYFSEGLNNGTNSLLQYNYLVKKVVFRVSILPVVKIISALFIHLFFIVFIFIMFGIYGYKPNIYNIQVVYYSFGIIVLLLGLSWITSSLMVFLKDTNEIIQIVLQFGFWLTPIFWSYTVLPKRYEFLLKLNPMFYITQGYRDAFIYKVWFWQKPNLTIYFWTITLLIFILGGVLFKKLKPHFSDVL